MMKFNSGYFIKRFSLYVTGMEIVCHKKILAGEKEIKERDKKEVTIPYR